MNGFDRDPMLDALKRTFEELDPVPSGLTEKILVAVALEDLELEYELLTMVHRSQQLAGVPAETIRQAKAYLARLDQFSARSEHQADLFAASVPASSPEVAADPRAAQVVERLAAIDPDALSPREALDALYALKRLAGPDD